MRPLEILTTHEWVRDLGLALLHSLWQATAIALLLAGVLLLLRGKSAGARHVIACAALCLMVLSPLITFWRASASAASPFAPSGDITGHASAPAATSTGLAPPDMFAPSDRRTPETADRPRASSAWERFDEALPWLALVWLLGALVMSARLLLSWRQLRRLTREASRPTAGPWPEALGRVARHMGAGETARLLQSLLVRVPSTVGWLRPVILLPDAAGGLTAPQMEAILAHELAHVRRRDYLVNLFQRAAEGLLFYHPAAWWVSRRIRVEREHACDDLAVAAYGDPLLYARALTKVQRLRQASAAPSLAIGAADGLLLRRVRRLVDPPGPRAGAFAESLAGLTIIGAVLAVATVTEASLLPKAIRLADARRAGRAARPAQVAAAPEPAAPLSGKPESSSGVPAVPRRENARQEPRPTVAARSSQTTVEYQEYTPPRREAKQEPLSSAGTHSRDGARPPQTGGQEKSPPLLDIDLRDWRPVTAAEAQEMARRAREAGALKQARAREQLEELSRRARAARAADRRQAFAPGPRLIGFDPQTPYYRWLNEDVVYIITAEERRAFAGLRTDEEREAFIEGFWRRRDPRPQTDRNEYREEHYRRIAYANETFSLPGTPGWMTERGRAYIIYGRP